MSSNKVKGDMKSFGKEKDIIELTESSATVDLAAQALHISPSQIAKTLAFELPDAVIVIVMSGDVKIDNHLFKEQFHTKAKMLSKDDTLKYTGHAVGGVCPFALPSNVKVFFDESLKAFSKVYPACGSSNSAIGLTILELEEMTKPNEWIKVTKVREEA